MKSIQLLTSPKSKMSSYTRCWGEQYHRALAGIRILIHSPPGPQEGQQFHVCEGRFTWNIESWHVDPVELQVEPQTHSFDGDQHDQVDHWDGAWTRHSSSTVSQRTRNLNPEVGKSDQVLVTEDKSAQTLHLITLQLESLITSTHMNLSTYVLFFITISFIDY